VLHNLCILNNNPTKPTTSLEPNQVRQKEQVQQVYGEEKASETNLSGILVRLVKAEM